MTTLVLEGKDQASRIREALKARTVRLVGPGREHWGHICDKCFYSETVNGQSRK